MATVGVLSGTAIAIGVPWVLLANGQTLGAPVLTTLIIVAIGSGGLVALVSAFFGLVIPRHVQGRWMDPERWEKFARQRDKHRPWWYREEEASKSDGPAPRRRR